MPDNGMKLSEFIKTTLIDIATGIKSAQDEEVVGELVAPSQIGGHTFPEGRGVSNNSRHVSTVVEFDIAVTISQGKESGGSIKGTWISVISASLGTKTTNEGSSISRVQFSVPMLMPANKE